MCVRAQILFMDALQTNDTKIAGHRNQDTRRVLRMSATLSCQRLFVEPDLTKGTVRVWDMPRSTGCSGTIGIVSVR
jgi:hypothetical protein